MNKNLAVALVFLLAVTLIGMFALIFMGENGDQQPGEGNGVFGSLFPFLTNPLSGGQSTDTDTTEVQEGDVPTLRLVSEQPVSGATFTARGHIRYVERETGHVYETSPDSLERVRISNTTIPGIQETVFVSDTRLILRYLDGDTIASFSGFLASSTPDQALVGGFLPESSYVERGSNESILLGVKTNSGFRLDSANPDGSSPRTLFSSPVSAWIPKVSGKSIFLTTAPSALAAGYMYELSAGGLTRVFGGYQGLMTLPDERGRYVAFSASGSDRSRFGAYDRETGETIPLPAATLVPKCAWFSDEPARLLCGVPESVNQSVLPDAWLMGEVLFEDRIWILYPESRAAEIVADPMTLAGVSIDVKNPVLSPDGKFVVFMNKGDGTLWSLTLSPQ